MIEDYYNYDRYLSTNLRKEYILSFSDGTIINNSDFRGSGLVLNERLCSGDELRFGACESASVDITIFNDNTTYKGKTVTISQILEDDTEHPVLIGTFVIDSEKITNNQMTRQLVGHDSMATILAKDVTDWYKEIPFPDEYDSSGNKIENPEPSTVTLKYLRDSFFEYLDIDQVEVDLVNDDIIIEKTLDSDSKILGRDVVEAICQINGCFGHITRDEKFRYVFLPSGFSSPFPALDRYPSLYEFPSEATGDNENVAVIDGKQIRKPKNFSFSNYEVGAIGKVSVIADDGSVGGLYGEGTNMLEIAGNFLIYGASQSKLDQLAERIYSVVSKISPYRAMEGLFIANPLIEVGDGITVFYKDQIIETYVMQRTITGVSGLRDKIISKGLEVRSNGANTVNSELLQAKQKSLKIVKSVEKLAIKVTNNEVGIHALEITAEGLSDYITNVNGQVSELKITAAGLDYRVKQENVQRFKIPSGLTIDYNGYGSPELQQIIPEIGEIYLDLDTGNYYLYEGLDESTNDPLWDYVNTLTEYETGDIGSYIEALPGKLSFGVNGIGTAGYMSLSIVDKQGRNQTVGTVSMDSLHITAAQIHLTGNATFDSLLDTENGTTVIDGGKIKTGSISAGSVKINEILHIGPSGGGVDITSSGVSIDGGVITTGVNDVSGSTYVSIGNPLVVGGGLSALGGATISGNVFINGGDLQLGVGGTGTVYGHLDITSNRSQFMTKTITVKTDLAGDDEYQTITYLTLRE